MFYFYQNQDVSLDWEQAYRQFLENYTKLAQDCQKAVLLSDSLRLKIETISKQNQKLRAKKIARQFANEANPFSSLFLALPQPQAEQMNKSSKQMTRRIRKKNSNSTQSKNEGGSYECTYPGCGRSYSSSVSMNLHIKIKHNGGTKKEREACAKALLDAEERGEQPPSLEINLPPNFIEEFRTSYEYMKKYSM